MVNVFFLCQSAQKELKNALFGKMFSNLENYFDFYFYICTHKLR